MSVIKIHSCEHLYAAYPPQGCHQLAIYKCNITYHISFQLKQTQT